MAAKKNSDPLKEKIGELASVARKVIRELAAKDNTPAGYEAAKMLEGALKDAEANARKGPRKRSSHTRNE